MTNDPKMAFNAELGIRLEVSRRVLDLTVPEMRELLGGITASAYSKFKNGQKMPEPYRLAPLLDRGFTADWLMFGRVAMLPNAILAKVEEIEPQVRAKQERRSTAAAGA